jgi:hypothetical protein
MFHDNLGSNVWVHSYMVEVPWQVWISLDHVPGNKRVTTELLPVPLLVLMLQNIGEPFTIHIVHLDYEKIQGRLIQFLFTSS